MEKIDRRESSGENNEIWPKSREWLIIKRWKSLYDFFTDAETKRLVEEFQEKRQEWLENIKEAKEYNASVKEKMKSKNQRLWDNFQNSN